MDFSPSEMQRELRELARKILDEQATPDRLREVERGELNFDDALWGELACANLLGVGAAFDFLSGMKPQSPRWLSRFGLEWLFRLCTEPRRLWKRYLKHNPRFAVLFAMQLAGLKSFDSGAPYQPQGNH